MLARFILALLLVVGAAPASAMPATCHGDAGMTMAMAAPAPGPRPHRPVAVDHGCVGCAALADWLAERVVAPVAAPSPAPVGVPARLVVRAPPPPVERPPRIG